MVNKMIILKIVMIQILVMGVTTNDNNCKPVKIIMSVIKITTLIIS